MASQVDAEARHELEENRRRRRRACHQPIGATLALFVVACASASPSGQATATFPGRLALYDKHLPAIRGAVKER